MMRFVAGRLVSSVVVLWAIITISFMLMRFAPGSPFDADRKLPPAVEANKWILFDMGVELTAPIAGKVTLAEGIEEEKEYPAGTKLATVTGADGKTADVAMSTGGKLVSLAVEAGETVEAGTRVAVVPKSLFSQYLTTLKNYSQLEFGVTIASEGQRTVWENIKLGMPISLELGLWALCFALFFGIGAGLLAGLKQNTWVDYTVMSGAMTGISVPTIVSGPLLIVIFMYWLQEGVPVDERLFRIQRWESWNDRLLPVLTLGLVYTAYFARITRGGMLEVINSDYIRTARAKGLSERAVVMRHALKGAILPTVSFLGPAVARIVTGSIIVERVYGLPGLSEYFITPALNRDYPMVLGVVVLYSMLLVVMNLLVDIAYTVLDPRVSYD